MIEQDGITKILYGGDYNPEQWPEEIWQEDMRLFHLAHVNVVTLNVFAWASLQPAEDVWDFSRLDRIMDLVRDNDLKVVLATSTAVHPAWMARKYPEVLRVNENGIRRKFGSRHNSCPNSPVYRKYSAELAGRLASRYKDYPNLVAWHVSNEYGGMCYCDNCEKAFREWLKVRYGTLENLNQAWNTSFWSHTFYDWEEIVVPDQRSEEFYTQEGRLRSNFQGISLDYRRFMSESLQECCRLEKEAIKKETPDIPVTTNLMGSYGGLDYRRWAKDLDFISWDNYPRFNAPPWEPAFHHDLMRGLKQGKPFALMEQTPSVSNWHPACTLKRPGEVRRLSLQAVAHGSDTVMFFQMRQSIGACEKLHGALIGHRGNEDTRVFKEMAALGEEVERLGDATLGGRTPARAALVFDWENLWGTELSAGPSLLLDYRGEVITWYRAFWEKNIPLDVIGVEDSLEPYSLVVAPMLYMVKGDFGERISRWVRGGGCFVTGYFTGYVEEHDLIMTGGYPGPLKETLGIWVEEADALPPDEKVNFTFQGETYQAEILCDLIHLEGAQSLGTYLNEFYAGMPSVTKNRYGKGSAWYVSTHSSPAFYRQVVNTLCAQTGITGAAESSENVEVTVRTGKGGKHCFVLNHGKVEGVCTIQEDLQDLFSGASYQAGETISIAPGDVRIFSVKQ